MSQATHYDITPSVEVSDAEREKLDAAAKQKCQDRVNKAMDFQSSQHKRAIIGGWTRKGVTLPDNGNLHGPSAY